MGKRYFCFLVILFPVFVCSETSYIFAPGILESERYAAYYCPEYHASTGEVVTAATGIHVMHNPTSCNFSENRMAWEEVGMPLTFTSKVLTVLQRYRRDETDAKNKISIKTLYQTPRINDINLDIGRIYFGQERDIQTLSALYDEHIKKFPTGDIVLYGFSRGAATIFNFLATAYKGKADKRVKACVLEACFDTLPIPTYVPSALFNAIFPGYDFYGIQPVHMVKNFPQEIPVLFVTSKGDTRVPKSCVVNLFIQLYKAGHRKIHLLELAKAAHPAYTNNNQKDAFLYEAGVHNFYKMYGLD